MTAELSYVLLTPRTLLRGRAGTILSRLVARSGLEFYGAQIISFDPASLEEYADLLAAYPGPAGARLHDYAEKNLLPGEKGKPCGWLLLFRGEAACARLNEVVGELTPNRDDCDNAGQTIRDTFADWCEEEGECRCFEPAVLTPPSAAAAAVELKLLKKLAEHSSKVIDGAAGVPAGAERTLLIVKPENWRYASVRPGAILDMLGAGGLRLVGSKLYHMTVADALEFYGPVQAFLWKKWRPIIAERAKTLLEAELKIKLPDSSMTGLEEAVGIPYGDDNFSQIVEFMAGRRPEECPESERPNPTGVKCLVLIFDGPDAIAAVRRIIGPTDSAKAPGGTVRRDFGADIMVNAVHASDSPDSVAREMKVVHMEQNDLAGRIG